MLVLALLAVWPTAPPSANRMRSGARKRKYWKKGKYFGDVARPVALFATKIVSQRLFFTFLFLICVSSGDIEAAFLVLSHLALPRPPPLFFSFSSNKDKACVAALCTLFFLRIFCFLRPGKRFGQEKTGAVKKKKRNQPALDRRLAGEPSAPPQRPTKNDKRKKKNEDKKRADGRQPRRRPRRPPSLNRERRHRRGRRWTSRRRGPS